MLEYIETVLVFVCIYGLAAMSFDLLLGYSGLISLAQAAFVGLGAYSTALLTTALVALDSGDAATAAGGALFLGSDALIALEKFADVRLPAHEAVVMTTYTAAQGLLALRSPSPAEEPR